MVVMSFIANLPPKFDTVKSHILSSLEISSLQEIFNWILRIKTPTVTRLIFGLRVRHLETH